MMCRVSEMVPVDLNELTTQEVVMNLVTFQGGESSETIIIKLSGEWGVGEIKVNGARTIETKFEDGWVVRKDDDDTVNVVEDVTDNSVKRLNMYKRRDAWHFFRDGVLWFVRKYR